jgi:hypothetical protein
MDKFEEVPFGFKEFISHWMYEIPNNYVRPIKLITYQRINNHINILIEFTRKSRELDEIKILCKDILAILNYEEIIIKNLKTNKS